MSLYIDAQDKITFHLDNEETELRVKQNQLKLFRTSEQMEEEFIIVGRALIEHLTNQGYTITERPNSEYAYFRGLVDNIFGLTFTIEQAPGWLFGAWLQYKEEGIPGEIEVEFFFQYKEEIDKFKPSASYYQITFSGLPTKTRDFILNTNHVDWSPFKEVIKHPYIAWYKNLFFKKPINGLYAYLVFHYHKHKKGAEARYELRVARKVLNLLRKHSKRLGIPPRQLFLYDCGENWSPRYQIRWLKKYDENDFITSGTYSLMGDEDLKNQYDKIREEDLEICAEKDYYTSIPFLSVEVYVLSADDEVNKANADRIKKWTTKVK